MKDSYSPEGSAKFSGNLRHYHRSSKPTNCSWDDWVNGTPVEARPSKNWPKIIGIAFGVLALGGVITGLVIELG